MERFAFAEEGKLDQWKRDLVAPLSGRDPDNVSQSTIADEMAAFVAFGREAGGG